MQGFNMGRYVPPDVEGTTSANRLHKKHALGQRASKLSSRGVLTVRFEMPFPVWCSSCAKPTIIGQGVRFNAEKKKVGHYYSSPIWSFRFRHAACGGTIEMRTDPKNTAYVVAQGATRRDTGEDRGPRPGDEALVIMTDQEREALRRSAFASLERTIDDRERLIRAGKRIEHLRVAQDRAWEDPYAMNQRLRRTFRVGRKERERDDAATEALRDKMGLAMELVPATDEDAQRAKLVDFGAGCERRDADAALAKPLFGAVHPGSSGAAPAPAPAPAPASASSSGASPPPNQDASKARPKADKEATKRKDDLVSAIMSNTRLVHDPFLQQQKRDAAKTPMLPGVKRKRGRETPPCGVGPPTQEGTASAAGRRNTPTLVEYDSD
ncbi:hypothetical protein E4U42_005430 [Claviceps africana]|uniref:Uncharacterized protein n=1 Tax=Claviceps africana TaxID=83212 RepID=A0A8K0J3M6_9HYPO|nr:hypothetical protein E4U42_005430 [Claviceps africana]